MRRAVIADIHGNVLALEAVLGDLARRGGSDCIINLGDCVSGPLWPSETLARLRSLEAVTVRGNHDRRTALDRPNLLGPSDRFARERLTPGDRDWLAELPDRVEVRPGVLAFHACPDDDENYLADVIVAGELARASPARITSLLSDLNPQFRLLLFGHSHRPELMRLPDGRILFNPGSVGCPAYVDDQLDAHVSESGAPHARYGIVELDSGDYAPELQHVAVAYDHETAARRAEACGRLEWARALRTGFITDQQGSG